MISKISWDDAYLLGIDEIDSQHKKLIAIANKLYDILTGSTDKYKILLPSILKEIKDYTVYHFSNEEKFMESYGYTGVSIHKTAHDSFIKEVEFQSGKLLDSDILSGEKFYGFIVNWILNHIAKADRVWAKFVETRL